MSAGKILSLKKKYRNIIYHDRFIATSLVINTSVCTFNDYEINENTHLELMSHFGFLNILYSFHYFRWPTNNSHNAIVNLKSI